MTTPFKDVIKKAYTAFNERDIDKALSTKGILIRRFQQCNPMCNGQKPGKVAT